LKQIYQLNTAMIHFDQDRFAQAASSFLTRFGLPGTMTCNPEALREIFRAFSHLPYENLSKILRLPETGKVSPPLFRTPEEVLEGYLADRLGGTCFSLTQCLCSLLSWCGFEAHRVFGDMRHGRNIHCAVVVCLGKEKYLCDAGYLLPEPVLMTPGGKSVLKSALYTYLLEADSADSEAYNLYTSSHRDELKWRYRIRDRTASDREFEYRWRLTFKAPMMRQIVLTRSLEEGQVYIHQHHLRLNLPQGKRNLNIRSSMTEKIEELFGIHPAILEKALIRIEQGEREQVRLT